jgi:hypothetical protein
MHIAPAWSDSCAPPRAFPPGVRPITDGLQAIGPTLLETTKDFDSGRGCGMVSYERPNCGLGKEILMAEKTCAACDCKLDDSGIKVTVGTHVVEVCCEECAQKLREARPRQQS